MILNHVKRHKGTNTEGREGSGSSVATGVSRDAGPKHVSLLEAHTSNTCGQGNAEGVLRGCGVVDGCNNWQADSRARAAVV